MIFLSTCKKPMFFVCLIRIELVYLFYIFEINIVQFFNNFFVSEGRPAVPYFFGGMTSTNSSSDLDILVRDPEGFFVWNGPPFTNGQPNMKLERITCNVTKFSDDGSRLMVIKSDGFISIYECVEYKEIRCFEIPNTLAAVLSPLGSYLETFQKPSSPEEKNVTVWKIDTGAPVFQHLQKNMTKHTWPSIHFSDDENVACRMVKNQIHFFEPTDFLKGDLYKINVPGVSVISLSKAPASHIAAYIPESKGIPASVQIFCCNQSSQNQPCARRGFFRCSTVQFYWNNGSTGLLVVVQSDVDKTNQNYYGESKLSYLTTDGSHEGLVSLGKDGPIHDAQWSYSGLEFAVLYGFMPAKATIFDKKSNPLFQLGTGPYNTIRWNPKGKLICLAGFGNLPGNMEFWDLDEKIQIGKTMAECSVSSEWSPDGCYFMTATTAPRLQVDNGFKIFHHNGSLYFKKAFDKLYQVEWKPASANNFGDINKLVKAMDTLKTDGVTQVVESKNRKSAKKQTPSSVPVVFKPAAYRPPHLKDASAIQAELLGGSSGGPPSKASLKNKKKRDKQKEKKATSEASKTC